MSIGTGTDCLLTTDKCHSERSEESKRDSSPVGLRMTKGVVKRPHRKALAISYGHWDIIGLCRRFRCRGLLFVPKFSSREMFM